MPGKVSSVTSGRKWWSRRERSTAARNLTRRDLAGFGASKRSGATMSGRQEFCAKPKTRGNLHARRSEPWRFHPRFGLVPEQPLSQDPIRAVSSFPLSYGRV